MRTGFFCRRIQMEKLEIRLGFMKKQNLKCNSHEALELLIEGNQRFASGLRSLETALSVSKMHDLVENGQFPFAIVLTCSDSRVPTEMVFDRGLGDLFVIRIAGNVTSPMVIASVEYAASQLESPLVVVMGHSHCGAVTTAVRAEEDNSIERNLSPDLNTLISAIRPAVRETRHLHGENIDFQGCIHESTWANVRRSVRLITEGSSIVQKLQREERISIVGAMYDLKSGVVKFEKEMLNQSHLHSPRVIPHRETRGVEI